MEIHPETPPEGRRLVELFPVQDIDRMMRNLRITGAPFGITFIDRARLSNSRLALQTAEFARAQGKFDALHSALFSAYFSLGLDIGDLDVIMQIAHDAGLDTSGLSHALETGKYLPKLEEARQEAGLHSLTGVPTFLIEEKKTIVGAQPLDVFRKFLGSA